MRLMNDTETLTVYEQTCSDCIDDLYRAAYLILADPETAEKLVTKICTAGVHRYGDMTDQKAIRYRLVMDLYRLCRQKLRFCTPSADVLPDKLRYLTKTERLTAVIWYVSGMSAAEFCEAIGKVVRKIPLK